MLRSLYVDLNSYFASVEQQLRPELRGKPIGVLPVLAETTCCIAASIDAKRFGIKTGTPVWQARKLHKNIIFVQARPATYVEIHHRIVAAVESCTPVTAVLSIDEMTCDLMGSEQQEKKAIALGKRIKQAIYTQVGEVLHSSIGIGPNRFLAKTASNMQKPDGLTVIRPEPWQPSQVTTLFPTWASLRPLHQRQVCGSISSAKASPQRSRIKPFRGTFHLPTG